jgi:hypothetical protein
MVAARPDAMIYLADNHKKLWTRSQYRTTSKVDYVTNNLAESFNNWIKLEKSKHLDDLLDTIRQKILIKWNHRKRVAMKFTGKILPHIEKKLREDSYNLDIEVITDSPEGVAEICAKGGLAIDLWSTYQKEHAPVGLGKGLESLASMQLLTSPQSHMQD